jgi:hypothetical protein
MPILGIIASSKLGAPAGAFESIASATGTGSSGTITFSSIPGTYQHLQLRLMLLNATNNAGAPIIRFNSDTGTNYVWHTLNGYNSTVTAAGNTAKTSINPCIDDDARASLRTTEPTVAIIDIHDYASTSKFKTVRSFGGMDRNAATSEIDLNSGLWRSTSAITSITITNNGAFNWSSDAQFALYGIKGA